MKIWRQILCSKYTSPDESWRLAVGEVKFYLDEEISKAFTDGHYRVYYLNKSGILSVEEIKKTT